MKRFQTFGLCLLFSWLLLNVSCAFEEFSLEDDKIISPFIGDLLRDGKAKDSSGVYDVAILRWERENQNFLYDEVVDELRKENVLIMPQSSDAFVHQRIRAASFVVIISDVTDSVSHFQSEEM